MRYYLETNAIYQISKYLILDKKISKSLFYSSFLSIFELLSGITPSEYHKRRLSISNLIKSGIFIDWTTPREAFTNAFPVAAINDYLANTVQKMADVVCNYSDYFEAESICNKSSLPWDFKGIVNADKFMSSYDKDDRNEMTKKFRQDYSKETISQLRSLVFQRKNDMPVIDSNFQKKNEEELLRIKARFIAKQLPGSDEEKKYDAVFQSYNGSLKWYVGAAAFIQAKDLLCGGTPAADDFFDMSHFIYIHDESDIIVSDDKLMKEICETLWPSQYSSVAKLKEIFSWSNK